MTRKPEPFNPWVVAFCLFVLLGIAFTLEVATRPADDGLRPPLRSVAP